MATRSRRSPISARRTKRRASGGRGLESGERVGNRQRMSMDRIKLAAVSRNYFNMPLWVGLHEGLFAAEGLDVALELHEPIDEVTDRLRDGSVDLALGVTEHVVLDSERGGRLAIIGGNVNKPPFSLIAGKDI